MKLAEGVVGISYEIEEITADASVAGRLEAFGIRPGATIEIWNGKKRGAVIVLVQKTKVALGRKIAEAVFVRPEGRRR